ncbi:non-ribosomal peptide synthetase module [Paenibacillus sediminis]|uniref:Non-ribosomal peptide synthetase module n=1 Tax=Paenibacillus sediminis TaxID=664909 RepID=A0ABS4H6Y4_9BACL|nr:non-ribosomal peptide synthetase module [Paenibacillus sediminis]MBP1938300.1 hypothetical protein [Paenibacillus sediminis]
MAKRLATEYVNARLEMSEAQMYRFVHEALDPLVHQKVKVLENGSQEIVLEDQNGEEIHLPFDKRDGFYVCELSVRLVNPRLTNAMRKLFVTYKGTGLVNRIYDGFIMVYFYKEGSVRKIVECSRESEKLVFEYKNTVEELERLYEAKDVELEISKIQRSINDLLDQRISADSSYQIQAIDESLRSYVQRLFVLEA